MGSALLLSIIVAYFALWISGKDVEKTARNAKIVLMPNQMMGNFEVLSIWYLAALTTVLPPLNCLDPPNKAKY
jgi:hypothetical protein